MKSYQVTFIREEKSVVVAEGTSLLQAEVLAGLQPDAPCGGHGKCGKCRLRYRQEGKEWQEALACETPVMAPLFVETESSGEPLHILLEGQKRSLALDSPVKRRLLHLEPRGQQYGISEWERLSKAAGEEVVPQLSAVRRLSELNTRDGGTVCLVYYQETETEKALALDVYPETEQRNLLGMAVDIGTTSVACYLVNLENGDLLATASSINPQFSYGADVIARANYALEKEIAPLEACIREKANELLGQLCQSAGADRRDVYLISMVGNSCMHHLFLGISPDSMVHAPYQPALNSGLRLCARDFGLEAAEGARLLWLPLIAGFVGADTVSGLLATELAWQEPMALLVDIGTNGELVLGNRDRRLACSTAAGPALEGAKIACGMRGTKGAIEHVDLVDGQLHCQVIGGGAPVGICGSGLIDAVAVLLKLGVLDESGHMTSEDEKDGGKIFWLWPPSQETDGVYLSQKDVRELQLAKGALAAGVVLMAKYLNLPLNEIKHVYLAGAFGTYLRPENACRIGLLPAELADRIQAVGNIAGEGARQVVLSREGFSQSERLARETEFLELASLPEFQDEFVDQLEFPD